MDILQQIKDTLKTIRRAKPAKHKPMPVLEKKIVKKKEKIVKKKREQITTVIDGRKLSLSRIAQIYNLEPHTVYARYRVGNRGKLLVRPSTRKKLSNS
jgi:hypothetical protein